jgi:hypothetical protein
MCSQDLLARREYVPSTREFVLDPLAGKSTMKSVSASLVLLSGALILTGGSFVAHDQTQGFLQFVGVAIGLVGLAAWFKTFKQLKD